MVHNIAKRLRNFDSSKIRMAFELAEKVVDPIDLSIGYPEDDTPDYIKSAGIKAIRENHTTYTPSNGLFELRVAIAEKLQRENSIVVHPNAVSISPGITTAILLVFLATLNEGDELLVPDPYFPPYVDVATMLGIVVKPINTYPDFQLTAAKIKPLITPKTKAIIINSPNNPSGAIYPEKELRKIATLAKKRNILLVSDEVYEHFAFDTPHFSIGSIYPNTITLNGFSKSYAMTGWRIGYIAGPKNIVDAINELQQYIVFSSSSISQYAAIAALKRNPKFLTTKYHAKRNLAKKLLEPTFEVTGCEGAFYAFVKLPKGIDDITFVNQAAKQGVLILPGSAFSSHKGYIRISFATDEKTLKKGLSIITKMVSENIPAKIAIPKRV